MLIFRNESTNLANPKKKMPSVLVGFLNIHFYFISLFCLFLAYVHSVLNRCYKNPELLISRDILLMYKPQALFGFVFVNVMLLLPFSYFQMRLIKQLLMSIKVGYSRQLMSFVSF